MEHYKKLLVWGMLASFPAAIYSLQSWEKIASTPAQTVEVTEVDAMELERVIDVKLKKITEMDVKILSTKGEVLKYQEQRKTLIKELEKIQERIKPHLRQAKK